LKALLITLLIPFCVSAGTFKITGPCEEAAKYETQYDFSENKNLGVTTLEILEAQVIPYVGFVNGIHSIYNTPTGREAIEIVSDQVLRSYGWCYEVDGVQPDVMPDAIALSSHTQLVHWFFAYSTLEEGTWKDYCTPSYKIKPQFLCPE
jgi:hypothetical protein